MKASKVKKPSVRLLMIEGACVEEHIFSIEFSVAGLLKHNKETLLDYSPDDEDDASAIEVFEGELMTSVQFFNSEGEFTQYIGLTSDFKK